VKLHASAGLPSTGSVRETSAGLLRPELLRIVSALAHRARYRYVQPVVVPEGAGWKIVSPNCSRNIDPQGGDIDIAWLVPEAAGGAAAEDRWQLHARDHSRNAWRLLAIELTLDAALQRICTDTRREFWP
jgi:hypothetical protein